MIKPALVHFRSAQSTIVLCEKFSQLRIGQLAKQKTYPSCVIAFNLFSVNLPLQPWVLQLERFQPVLRPLEILYHVRLHAGCMCTTKLR